jgi:hypothetical protein
MGKTIDRQEPSSSAARKPADESPFENARPDPKSSDQTGAAKSPARKRRSSWRIVGILLLAIVLLIACARPCLPWAVRWYVNRTLDRNELFEGRIGDITLNLWRGAYSIADIRFMKKTGNVPRPFFEAKKLELAIQWDAILHRKVVGQVIMDQPDLNFVDSSDESAAQTGAGGPWLQILEGLFPFQLNSVRIQDGSVHFRSYRTPQPVDVYLSHLEASVDDLTNIRESTTPLLTTVTANAQAMDQAKFEFRMKLDPFSYRPTFQLGVRLLGLDVTTLNDLARAYGQFYFKRGWFDLVIEANASEGQLQGTVKPLFRDLKVFDLLADLKNDSNPLQFFWQALLGVTTRVLTNQQRDQFGTAIPFTGDLTRPDTDIVSTVGNVLRNAFVRAYLPRFENGTQNFDGMQFGPPTITDPVSVGDEQ